MGKVQSELECTRVNYRCGYAPYSLDTKRSGAQGATFAGMPMPTGLGGSVAGACALSRRRREGTGRKRASGDVDGGWI